MPAAQVHFYWAHQLKLFHKSKKKFFLTYFNVNETPAIDVILTPQSPTKKIFLPVFENTEAVWNRKQKQLGFIWQHHFKQMKQV